jgi:hypothetical protein
VFNKTNRGICRKLLCVAAQKQLAPGFGETSFLKEIAMPRSLDEDLHVPVSAADKARFKALAEKDGRTISSLARRVILSWLNRVDKQSKATA